MSASEKLTLRLSPAQRRILQRLSRKLHLDETNTIRLAITRLPEAEGVLEEKAR